MELRDWLQQANIKPHQKGYYYIIFAIKLLKEEQLVNVKIMELYKNIAKKYNVSDKTVARCIRNVKGKGQYAYHTNGEFLMTLAEKVQRGIINIEEPKEVEI